jgi:hypothetical protein
MAASVIGKGIMLEGTFKDGLSHWGIAIVAQFLTHTRVAQGSSPCMGELFQIPFNGIFLHLILANYLAPETILHFNVKSVKTQLLRRVGLHMNLNLVSQLLKQLLCRSYSLALLDFLVNAFFTLLCL